LLTANSTGKGVQAAVIDSGIDARLPALQEGRRLHRSRHGADSSGAMKSRRHSYTDEVHGHACGNNSRIARCCLISVKVLQRNNYGSGAALIAGFVGAQGKGRIINKTCPRRKEVAPELMELCEQADARAPSSSFEAQLGRPGFPPPSL
jgi:hypothetical protein